MPRPHLIRDGLALGAVLAALLVLLRPDLDPRGPRTIWVSPAGSDLRSGRSAEAAVATVQRAADMARPGDTVALLPGVYRERVRVRRGGSEGRPVVFRAAEPGTAILSGEAEPDVVESLEWRDEGDGIWSAETPWPVYHVRVEDRNAVFARWGGTGRLRRLASRPGAWDVFAWVGDAARVYIHVRGGVHPGTVELAINDRIPSPREWGNVRSANVWVEAGDVVFEDLRFRGGVGAGLLLWDADRVTVRDCLFEGATYGVQTRPRVSATTDLVVERSIYHNYPQHAWREGWLSWDEVYAWYSSSTLVASADDGVTVRDNVVAHFGDGLRLSGVHDRDPGAGVLVEGNLLFRGTDDAVELDGAGHDVLFRRNLVYDVHESLSFSPVTAGPTLVEDNLFLHPHGGVNGAQTKFLTPGDEPYDTIRGVRVTGNTFVGNWLSWWVEERPVDDVWIEANTFAVQRMKDPPWHPGVTARGNRMVELPVTGYPDPGADPRWWEAQGWRALEPGPRWLEWKELPATADIPRVLSPELVR